MRRKLFFSVSAIAIAAIAMYVSNEDRVAFNHTIYESDIEALTACESIGWWNNNGNCVKNSKSGEYFCKDDTWYELTDCKQ